MLTCAECSKKSCRSHSFDEMPKNCPTRDMSEDEIVSLYQDDALKEAVCSAIVECEGYCKLTRVEETMVYAHKMGYHKIGIAFCIGLKEEAKIFTEILRKNGFEVESIICKNGSVDKSKIQIEENDKLKPNQFEAMCNPIAQAKFLNEANTEFNVVIGLCVGHDSLFLRHTTAPTTVMIVKDRVLAHNPVGALYTYNSYYKKLSDLL